MAQHAEQEREQLWAIYWGIRALDRPPPSLRMARSELEAEVRHLTLVGGQG